MSNYKTAAIHARLLKLGHATSFIRRQRALQKYAQAVQMQKQALSLDTTGSRIGAGAGIGALGGGLLGAGLGYGLGKKDKKLMSTLLGAGIGTGVGAGVGGLGGYMLRPKPPKLSIGRSDVPSLSIASESPTLYIEGLGKRVDKVPDGLSMTAFNDAPEYGLEGDNWKMGVLPNGDRYVSNGADSYFMPGSVARAGTDYRNAMMDGEKIDWGYKRSDPDIVLPFGIGIRLPKKLQFIYKEY